MAAVDRTTRERQPRRGLDGGSNPRPRARAVACLSDSRVVEESQAISVRLARRLARQTEARPALPTVRAALLPPHETAMISLVTFVDLHDHLDTPEVFRLLTAAFSSEDAAKRAGKRYEAGDWTGLGYEDAGVIVAFIGLERVSQEAWIRGIAVDPDRQREGIGRALVRALRSRTSGLTLHAETDRDALLFYRTCGFEATSLGEKYPGAERFECVLPAGASVESSAESTRLA